MSKAEFPIVDVAQWLQTEPGQYVQRFEQKCFDRLVSDVFGYHALQVGMPSQNLLSANRMPFKAYAGIELPVSPTADWAGLVLAEPECLPFESQSVDLIVLPHGLEASAHPHQILREVERVLVPEGRVVLSGFNPWSLWGLRHRTPYLSPWLPQPSSAQVSLPRLKDWLKLLSFEIELGNFGCYVPPFRTKKWLERFAFAEAAGNRWWPVCGAVYVVSAVKRVAGMRLITPRWKTAKRLRKGARQTAGATLQQKNSSKLTNEPLQP
ncbi:MAG: SAM-dependent methyltransferase [Alcaligenaceae bacterium]|nr:MAG: SAM-dependent methyltransferase [Alcaligenaceae bacterium]